jgi:hypothetical protein
VKKCSISKCKRKATVGFISERGRIQPNKYCTSDARMVKNNGAFPRCKAILLKKYKM